MTERSVHHVLVLIDGEGNEALYVNGQLVYEPDGGTVYAADIYYHIPQGALIDFQHQTTSACFTDKFPGVWWP